MIGPNANITYPVENDKRRRVFSAAGKFVCAFESKYNKAESQKRMQEMAGAPFEHLPGKPDQHKVLAELSDGSKVRVCDIEMIYNDWVLFSYVEGDGTYEQRYANEGGERAKCQLEVLEMAKKLYAGSAS